MVSQDDGPMGWITDISTPEGRAEWETNQQRIRNDIAHAKAERAKDPVAYDAMIKRLRELV